MLVAKKAEDESYFPTFEEARAALVERLTKGQDHHGKEMQRAISEIAKVLDYVEPGDGEAVRNG